MYRSSVEFCHDQGCYQPFFSNGFVVINKPPIPGTVLVQQPNQTGVEINNLQFNWTAYEQPGINPKILKKLSSGVIMNYHWTVQIDQHGIGLRKQLLPWQKISPEQNEVSYTFGTALSPDMCLKLVLKGVNHVNLATFKEISLNCAKLPEQPVVLDAVSNSNIFLPLNGKWSEPDQEFTPSTSSLHAVWPSLRHGQYLWKVVSGEKINQWAFLHHDNPLKYQDYHCNADEVLACGETENNYITVNNLVLNDGRRYFICVFANATVAKFEKFYQELASVPTCSDGVVVDANPPAKGKVWIGYNDRHSLYTTATSYLLIHWNQFSDVEIHGSSKLHTGIAQYQIALGTSQEGIDIRPYFNIGIANRHVFRNLQLQQGLTYYATVKAVDFVGNEVTVSSEGVTVDVTAPEVTSSRIQTNGAYHISTSSIKISWSQTFQDPESGLYSYDWCLGSLPYHCDLQKFITTPLTKAELSNSTLEEKTFYVNVKARNGAGLEASACSAAVTLDQSPPVTGFVLDGVYSIKQYDMDAQNSATTLNVAWGGFYDGESHIESYRISVGSCPDCNDIISEVNQGLKTYIRLEALQLSAGTTYYSRVKACNHAGACTETSSDGIVVDDSPPIIGHVYDGASGEDIDYQSDRSHVCAHWTNVHDVHSDITSINWWIGTAPMADNIMKANIIHIGADYICAQLDKLLPTSSKIYVTLKATNLAGLSRQLSSDGFRVDITKPTILNNIKFTDTGSLKPGTQFVRSSIHVQWEFSDLESGIYEQYVSLMAGDTSTHFFPTVKLYGDVKEYIFANLTLYDGEQYKIMVIGCNQAKLCTLTESTNQLVDNSPPTTGAFAINTEHSVDLLRHQAGHMTYNDRTIKLAFLGFHDPHTDVTKYHITVGTKYDQADLIQGNTQVSHVSTLSHRDEGYVQKAEIILSRQLRHNEQIYISLWAENAVGLESRRLHGSFHTSQVTAGSGSLLLDRRCVSQSCEGHCTCAPQDMTCTSASSCADVKGKNGFQEVTVEDKVSWSSQGDSEISYYQYSLLATWKTSGTGISPQRYEWSVGVKGSPPGTGLIDRINEPIWRDSGLNTRAIYNVKRTANLQPLTDYVFYIRVWYSENEVSIVSSSGIRVDGTFPELSRSKNPIEVAALSSTKDIDFLTQSRSLNVSWKGVFRDIQSSITSYKLLIGTSMGDDSVKKIIYSGTTTSASLNNLVLQEEQMYYTTVEAYNAAGLHSVAHSDGFMVDFSAPHSDQAVLWDGHSLYDINYQHHNDTVSASWHGFYDTGGSDMHHFTWCVGSTPGADDVITCQNVGMALQAEYQPAHFLKHGHRYYSKVQVHDSAGLESQFVISNGFIVDQTPPVEMGHLKFGESLIVDGFFEKNRLDKKWTIEGTVVLHENRSKSGSNSILMQGSIQQKIQGAETDLVKVTFLTLAVSDTEDNGYESQELLGYIEISELSDLFSVKVRPTDETWQRHIYYSHITKDSTFMLKIGTLKENYKFLLDDISVQPVIHDSKVTTVNPLTVDVLTNTDNTGYITASWRIEDPESSITKYQWAVGTIQGGVQLQAYRSLHGVSHARTEQLLLTHGADVHVTVVASNFAGLSNAFYSKPVKIDLLPPEICCLTVNGEYANNTIYVKRAEIDLTWIVKDEESGIKECKWSLGSTETSTDTLFPRISLDNTGHASIRHLHHGSILYVSVRCTNNRDLTSTLSSSSIIVVDGPPDVHNAEVFVVTVSPSVFEARDNHQMSTETLKVGWRGFQDSSGIKLYQLNIYDEITGKVIEWREIADTSELFCDVTDLSLSAYRRYTVSVRAVNHAGYVSKPVNTSVTIEVSPPIYQGTTIRSVWDNEWTMDLDWSSSFISNSSMVYMVTIGTKPGGIDVLSWSDFSKSSMKITGVDHSKLHYVTVTAINKAGLHLTKTFPVQYIPK